MQLSKARRKHRLPCFAFLRAGGIKPALSPHSPHCPPPRATPRSWSLRFEFEEVDLQRHIARAARDLLTREGMEEARRSLVEGSVSAARSARDACAAALEVAAHAEHALLGGTERAVRRVVGQLAREGDALLNPYSRREALDRYCRALNVEPSSVRVHCEPRMIGVRDEEREERVGNAAGFGCRWTLSWSWLGSGPRLPLLSRGSSVTGGPEDPAAATILTLTQSKRNSPQQGRGSGAFSPSAYSAYAPVSPLRQDSGPRGNFSGGSGGAGASAASAAATGGSGTYPGPASYSPLSPPRDTVGLANVSAAIDRLAV